MNRFCDEPLAAILATVREQLARRGRAVVVVPRPEPGRYPGERFLRGERALRHRSLQAWCDLAERLGCRLELPEAAGADHLRLTFRALGPEAPWHRARGTGPEKYGADSPFQRLSRLEEPRFLLDLLEALERARPPAGGRVLSLGVNTGDELAAFELLDPELAAGLRFVGVDHAASALALARERYPGHAFFQADLGQLDPLELGTFDLVLALGVMQSPGVDDRALLRRLVQRHLEPAAGLILTLPNGRYRDGELLYGARLLNFAQPELSLLVKDAAFYRRYLQQHRFAVNLTGKYDLFVTAVRR